MITLRPANERDIPLLKFWDQQPHVIASDPEEWDWEEDFRISDPAVQKFIAVGKGQDIGFLQIMDPRLERTHYWGEIGTGFMAIDIWIGEEGNLNKGYGTRMMSITIAKCFEDEQVHTILIDPLKSNTAAHRFYRRLGFHFVEERIFNEEEVCFVFKLNRHQWLNTQ